MNFIKQYAAWLFLAVFTLVTPACSDDFLDVTPQGALVSGNFWQTEEDAVAASNALYYYFTSDNYFGRGFLWFVNASDDMVTGRSDAGSALVRNFTATGDEGRIRNFYPYNYEIIGYANNILRNLPEMEINEQLKNRIMGEAYFMRGFAHFYLSHMYGDDRSGVPIVTVDNMTESFFPRTASVVENYAAIVEDFQRAAELLPYFTSYSSADLGRAHKDAAYAFMAKTYLYWGHYDDSKWAEAVKAADEVINSPSQRALINTGNPSEDFASVFYVENNWSSEYIWTVVSDQQTGSIQPGVMLENQGWGLYNGWGYFHPTLSLYEAFEEGDARKKATILEFGDNFDYLGSSRQYFSVNSWTGFQFNKFMEPYRYPQEVHLNPSGNKVTTNLNPPIMRFAELLLIKSEALIQQGQNGDEGINQIRQRVGLAPISNATLEDLKQERRAELAGEIANRHFDLVRWGDAQAVYAQPDLGRQHVNKEDPDSDYAEVEVWPARNFNPNVHHVWPIPPQVLAATGISQNEGW